MEIGEFKCGVCPHKKTWIPVKDKLPDMEKNVLLTDGEIIVVGRRLLETYQVAWDLDLFRGAVAWMPLPDPYEVQGDEV